MGAFEDEDCAFGTNEIAKAIVDSDSFSLIGGGDTIAAVKRIDLLSNFSFVSTGGSAMLEFLIKGNLPGLEALGYNG
jgi:phosphoglycerate kinase